MHKETITIRQAVCILIMFIFGSSVIMGVSSEAAQDSWISLLLAAVFATPVILVYARISRLYPEKDLFEIIESALGKIAGKIVVVLMVWYAIHLGALVLRNFSEFIQIETMPETPQLPIMIAMILVVVYMAKSGIETMGRWSIFMLSVVVFVVVITVLFSLNKIDFMNILPVMEHDIGTIAKGSFQLFTFPYAETVLFLGAANAIKKSDSPYKVYLHAILIGTVILLAVILRNTLLLGSAMIDAEYFSSYVAVRIIEVGEFFQRIEGSIAMNFILAGIIKIAVCMMAASKGTARLFGIEDYRRLVFPVGLLIVALCAVVYRNVMEMFDFLKVYQYYALPFQIAIPLTVWIAAEIRTRGKRTIESGEAGA
jgi:spore germination protein KB